MSKKNGIYKKCLTCDKEIYVKRCLIKRKKYCSRSCLGQNTDLARGLVEKNTSAWNKGKKLHYDVWNKGLKGYGKGEKNGMWKGDKVGYSGLHKWVISRLGKAVKCEECGENKKRVEWANKSHEYRRVLEDWRQLCCSCHYAYDRA